MKRLNFYFCHLGFVLALVLFLLTDTVFAQVNESTTITWLFSSGAAGQTATFSGTTSAYFTSNAVAFSTPTYLSYAGTRTYPTAGVVHTQIGTSTKETSASATNLISFNVQPAVGLQFTPTNISFNCGRVGTNGGTIDIKWISSDGTSRTIATGVIPARLQDGSYTPAGVFSVNYPLESYPTSTGNCYLAVYLYNFDTSKQLALANIVINGTIKTIPAPIVVQPAAVPVSTWVVVGAFLLILSVVYIKFRIS